MITLVIGVVVGVVVGYTMGRTKTDVNRREELDIHEMVGGKWVQ